MTTRDVTPDTPALDVDATMAVPPSAAEPRIAAYPYRPGELILTGYRLEKRLGSGGFGEVWRATAPGGMGVAIKILANLERAQGGREYRALQTIKNIRHAHIVPIFGVWLKSGDGLVLGEAALVDAERHLLAPERGRDPNADADNAEAETSSLESLELVIAMGLGDQTLHDQLKECGRRGEQGLPVDQLVDWMHQAALALDHFNSGSRRSGENATAVQHCDIKPQNILLVGDAVQVCDFGLARAQGEVRATSNTMASLAYAAPEMVSGSRDPAPSTDQYSLALTYVELRTGRLPYPELSPAEILRAKLGGGLDLSVLPPAEAKIVARALAVDPARRWQSCVEFVRGLRAATKTSRGTGDPWAIAAATPAAHPGSESVDPTVRSRWLSRAIMGLAVAAIAAATIGGVLVASKGDVPPTRDAAVALQKAGKFVDAGGMFARLLADQPDTLAAVLWDLQTAAADARQFTDCIVILRRLEQLYARSPPPKVKGITRWDVVNSLAWYLATDVAGGASAAADSKRLADEGLALVGSDEALMPQALDTAAAAAARNGLFPEAVILIDKAVAQTEDPVLRAEFLRRKDAYSRGTAWNEQ